MRESLPPPPLPRPPLKLILLAIAVQARINARLREIRVTRPVIPGSTALPGRSAAKKSRLWDEI
jgi:hypothetical protein